MTRSVFLTFVDYNVWIGRALLGPNDLQAVVLILYLLK